MRKRILILALIIFFAPLGIAHSGEFEDGVDALDRGDYKEAFSLLKPLADLGLAEAQFALGAMYADGEGVPQDYTEAIMWVRKAADQGMAFAQFTLGAMYQDGLGVLESPSAGIDWYYKAGMSFLEDGEREMALTCYDAIQKVDYGHFLGRKLQNYLYRIPEEQSSGKAEDAWFERQKEIEELEAEARRLYESYTQDDPDAPSNIRFRAYYDRIWSQIRSSWVVPEGVTTKMSLVTVVGIRIAEDGEIEEFWIEERSGNEYYDQSALRAIRKANPLPPLPVGFGDKSLEVGINFRYPE